MNRGFYLTLMMGGFNASPVPEPVIEALQEVSVSSTVGAQAGFQLKFSLGKNSLVRQMHDAGKFDPRQRVVIAVTVNGATEVLMDGIITRQDLAPSSAAGKSTLSITGLDLTALMDFIDLTGIPYPALPNFVIVEAILAKYAVLGVTPLALPASIPTFENPLERFIKQQGSDYRFVTTLAKNDGAVFYLDPGPTPGKSLAYWGPDLSKLFGGPQPALSINLDASTNLDSISFSYDGTLATQYLVTIIEPITKIPIPIPVPNIDLLKAPLAAHAPTPLRSVQLKPVANESPAGAALAGLASQFQTVDAISANGSLDVLRFGHVFKARQLAAVRGAGNYYDGKYYVKSVSHSIKRGEYKQSFTLSRGGTGSSVSSVSP
ncbi:hypothetical protein LMG28688_05776 [Paraburkholderia caffeinitolerans]|uniref:Phage late control D family protein n=1 Tax=Paraburkholderia caffeinitolerans TaxID=1723730 RepID=A0A6J5GM77_9BURK|nr:hypothetical protein [Paraburkholderia caffeinitolerans]CAB3803387.1 hypothetical protein LMG28688_05776 [Paraburkholderia caffeinitolerans]